MHASSGSSSSFVRIRRFFCSVFDLVLVSELFLFLLFFFSPLFRNLPGHLKKLLLLRQDIFRQNKTKQNLNTVLLVVVLQLKRTITVYWNIQVLLFVRCRFNFVQSFHMLFPHSLFSFLLSLERALTYQLTRLSIRCNKQILSNSGLLIPFFNIFWTYFIACSMSGATVLIFWCCDSIVVYECELEAVCLVICLQLFVYFCIQERSKQMTHGIDHLSHTRRHARTICVESHILISQKLLP